MTATKPTSLDAFVERFLALLLDEHGPGPEIDWDRYRLMQLIPGTAGASDVKTRDQLVARGFVEIGKGPPDGDSERRSIAQLRALILQIIGLEHRVVRGYENPMRTALALGPAKGTPPNLARLLSAVADIVGKAEIVTIASQEDPLGERIMSLLFVDRKYVGFLPGKLHQGRTAEA